MENKIESFLLVRSNNKRLDSVGSHDCVIEFDSPIQGVFKVIHFSCPLTWYTIDNTNNKLYFNESGLGSLIATLDSGNYTSSQLMSEIGSKMSTASSGSTYTATLDSNSQKITLTSDTNNFGVEFGSNIDNSVALYLGFENLDTPVDSKTVTSTNIINLNPHSAINMIVNESSHRNINTLQSFFNSNLYFPFSSGSFGDIVKFNHRESFDQILTIQTSTKKLSVKIFDSLGNNRNLNGVDWEMLLKKLY